MTSPGPDRASSTDRFPALTGIRAIAAYLVFVHHYANTSQVAGPLYRFLGEGHVGVTLFYVLSGFLITWNYSGKAFQDRSYWFLYVSRRMARIYPLYVFLLILTWAVPLILYHASPPTFMSAFLNVTLWKGFFDKFKFDGIGPSWSLTVEETFYLFARFLFAAVRRFGYVTVQGLLYAAGGLLLILGSHVTFYGFFGDFRFVALYTFFGRSFEFILGMALADAIRRRPELLTKSEWPVALTYLGLGGAALLVFWMSLLRHGTQFGVFHPLGMALNNLILPVLVCVLFLGLVRERTWLQRMLSTPAFLFLGRTSYAFYLVHFGVVSTQVAARLQIANPQVKVAVLFVALNIIAAVLYLLIEHPANMWIRRWADRRYRFDQPHAAAACGERA